MVFRCSDAIDGFKKRKFDYRNMLVYVNQKNQYIGYAILRLSRKTDSLWKKIFSKFFQN